MINNLIAFTQRFIFGAGLLSITGGIAAGVYFTRYFHLVADISMLHCVNVIAKEAELTDRERLLMLAQSELLEAQKKIQKKVQTQK